jgi:hypothetical protein
VQFHLMYGQPFGAGHAVPNFYRIAEWFCRFVRRYFRVQVEHFFDDFFVVEPEDTIGSAHGCLKSAATLLGLDFDPEKDQLPAAVFDVLGVTFDASAVASEACIRVRPKTSRVKALVADIDDIFRRGTLRNHQAASLVGKYTFINDQMFGRVGRAVVPALRARSTQPAVATSLTPAIRASLSLMKAFMATAPPRKLPLNLAQLGQSVLYTDASDVPGRAAGRYMIGGVLFSPRLAAPEFFFAAVPEEVVAQWLPKKTQIGQLELFAGPVALDTWAECLHHTCLFHWIDNDSATASIIKGYSARPDSVKIVGDYWLRAARQELFIYADRVPSKSNIADGPSRFDFAEVSRLGCIQRQPRTDLLYSSPPCRDPALWFA